MSRIIGGFGISHTPSMGIEYDKGMAQGFDPRWQKWFDGTRRLKQWLADTKPDKMVIVYNDHLNHFDFDAYPTIAIGVAPEFCQADEGWGPRPFPSLVGDVDLGWHMTNKLVRGGYDLTVCQDLAIDHGIYSWLPYVMDTPWDTPIVPIAINMVRHPIPTSERLHGLGKAIRAALEDDGSDDRIAVVSTGGMSHQISGARFGIANETLDEWFLSKIGDDVEELIALPQEELMRLGGTEAAELALWFSMRGALSDDIGEVYRYYTFPAITGCGVIVFDDKAG
ncbi:protocatechuate 3,4-dioxygenase [Oricola sp.]|uniref:DODA-type extradiol aromatic ring-opening family dioxygenase n=1 Tax=Oricola sp. TaxID=1979950 RepID=UPI0025F58198|nr:protocatechuate 3,4-dioxygenase [Oricola sp.]MCI5075861.1 protocatechuate 3,4-dioxygenase [Oricola sp.]